MYLLYPGSLGGILMNNTNSAIVKNCEVWIDGKKLPPHPDYGSNKNNITMINDKIFINGYEFKNGVWKRTFRSLLYLFF